MLVRSAAGHVQHMQKALEQMNVKLTEVVSNITGVTGMLIITAILDGERDPVKLAKLRDRRPSPRGRDRPGAGRDVAARAPLRAPPERTTCISSTTARSMSATGQVEAELAKLPDRSGEKERQKTTRRRGRKSNDVRFEAKGPLFEALGVDLTAIEGIDAGTVLVVLSEVGPDVSRFPTEKHFASWLRLCPPQDRSNKTDRRRRGPKGASRLSQALRMAAQTLGRTQTPLGVFYRRIRSRLGGVGAVKATAAQAGVPDLPDAQVRPGVRGAVDGGVRGEGEGEPAEVAGAEGEVAGVRAQPAAGWSSRIGGAAGVARQARGHAQRRERETPRVVRRSGGSGGSCGRRTPAREGVFIQT